MGKPFNFTPDYTMLHDFMNDQPISSVTSGLISVLLSFITAMIDSPLKRSKIKNIYKVRSFHFIVCGCVHTSGLP